MPMIERGRTAALIGAKGGVGTTVLTCSLAWALAQRGLQVLVLDLDRHGGQAALHLCERNAGPTVREALAVIGRLDATLLDTLLTPCSPKLRLLPSPRAWVDPTFEPPCDGQALAHLVRTAGELADFVLLDLPATALQSADGQRLLEAADDAILIGEPTLPAAFNARRAWQHLRELREATSAQRLDRTRFVLNKVQTSQGLPAEQVRRTLGLEAGCKAWQELARADALVAQATYEGQPVGALDPRHALSRGLSVWASEWASERASEHAGERHTEQDRETAARVGTPLNTWRERLQRWAS